MNLQLNIDLALKLWIVLSDTFVTLSNGLVASRMKFAVFLYRWDQVVTIFGDFRFAAVPYDKLEIEMQSWERCWKVSLTCSFMDHPQFNR
jgi:hypothetical protein